MQSVDRTQAVAVYRPLGAEEQLYWLYAQAHPLHFALTAQIRGRFSVHQLQEALTLIQQRHPLLRVRIVLDEAEQPLTEKQNIMTQKTLIHNSKKTQPQLSMIWVKEFDGERERLVARWVKQD